MICTNDLILYKELKHSCTSEFMGISAPTPVDNKKGGGHIDKLVRLFL